MAEVVIRAGVCGFVTRVRAESSPEGDVVLTITSDCPSVQRLAEALPRVDPFREISYRGDLPAMLEAARAHLPHPPCIVPSGIIKVVEVAAGLALPVDAGIEFVDDDTS